MAYDQHTAEPDGSHAPTPENGHEAVVLPPTRAQAAYFAVAGQTARDCQDRVIPVTRNGATVLRAMTMERRASLDMRLVGHAMDGPGKIDAAAIRIAGIWRDHGGLQVVFCDTGLHSAGQRWSIRSELAGQLSGHGIPAAALRFPAEPPWPSATAGLAAECADGRICVLIGHTQAVLRVPLAPGLITAAHHLDAPFTTADARRRAAMEPQQEDRAAWAATVRYITEGSSEAAQWHAIDAGLDPGAAALHALTGRPAAATRTAPRTRAAARSIPHPRRRSTPGRGA